MLVRTVLNRIVVTLRDMVVGLLLFVALAMGLSGDDSFWRVSSASAYQLSGLQPEGLVTAGYTVGPHGHASSMVILGLTVATMFAFNVALLRHLRSAYVRAGNYLG
ncbi:MAG: hypothetical protein R3D68_06230 [Hyphomicrobiaceae bacterium]